MKMYTSKFFLGFVVSIIYDSLFVSHGFASKNIHVETLNRLQIIRSIGINPTQININKYDFGRKNIWSFFLANKKITLPILERELRAETVKKKKNDFFLLEIGHFLFLNGSVAQKETATRALYSIDSSKISITANFDKLFHFTYLVSKERYPGILEFVDDTFFSNVRQRIVTADQPLTLDGAIICVFLYGAYGPDSEQHLLTNFTHPKKRLFAIEILTWIGSEQSVPRVKKAIFQETDYNLLTRALTYLLQNGGPEGIQVILELPTNGFNKDLLKFYDRIHKAAKIISLESLTARYSRHPGKTEYSDEELKQNITHMYDKGKLDRQLNPVTIIKSKLSNQYLLLELSKIRRKMFSRISYLGMGDIQFINSLMNAIQFR